jgi:hypothetical protein
MAAALKRLSLIAKRPDLLDRDPMLPVSFALTSEFIIERRQPLGEQFIHLSSMKELGKVLDADGRPLRK